MINILNKQAIEILSGQEQGNTYEQNSSDVRHGHAYNHQVEDKSLSSNVSNEHEKVSNGQYHQGQVYQNTTNEVTANKVLVPISNANVETQIQQYDVIVKEEQVSEEIPQQTNSDEKDYGKSHQENELNEQISGGIPGLIHKLLTQRKAGMYQT